jgi:hypothetical protein
MNDPIRSAPSGEEFHIGSTAGMVAGQVHRGDEERRLLTKRGLAEFLGVTVRTVETYQRRGLPYFRLGPRRNRYDLVMVRQWLERNCRVVRVS